MTNTQAPQESASPVPSDRLWLRSELMGTQVITRDTGRRLGLVGEVVVDIDRREVVALGLRDNPLTRFLPGLPRWLPLDQIRQVGDVILVDTIDSLSENFVPERFNKVINCQVITESGDQLGRVLGFSFDIETGELLTLVMGALGVPLLGEGVLSTWEMPVDEIVSSGPDRIIVYEGAEEKLKQLNSGFLEKLGVGNSGWEDSERERYRVNLVPVENQLTSGESANDDQRLLEQSQEEIFEEEEMEYVELQDSEEEQYNQELRYLDEPNQSSIYSEIDEDEVNYTESKLNTRSDNFKPKINPRNIKNRSKITREEQPMDVEPLEKSPIKKPEESLSNDKEILDIEDPW
ncbi:PRC-barrel domain-containing protein [Prochlorococcus sp. MIT 0916]|uniref:PRC-barrel domain-containing protein n=1 Tax=Prochlorococcus sp. MIT 0916 TaxID=3082521 RepID=UPI0039B65923